MMVEEWLQYLMDHAPELADQANSSIAWQQKWRDERISELEAGLRECVEMSKCIGSDEHIPRLVERLLG